MSVYVSDNFVRANGALGSNWATTVPNHAEFQPWTGTAAGNILINGNGVGPDATNGLDCCCLWAGTGAGSFNNDQWASAQFNSIAQPVAVLSITSVAGSGSTWVYTYTVTAGSVTAAIAGGVLAVVVSGMQNTANNGPFNPTTFGTGTFTVTNASGVAESGSTGIGKCPSDSGAGVLVRGSGTTIGTLNGYFFHAGTNSYTGDGRTAYWELWKVINGVGTFLLGNTGTTTSDTILPVIGDTIAISARGTTITAYKNGLNVFQVTDTDLASGTPGLWSFAVSGPGEYLWSTWNNGSSTQFGGNNGTTLNNFQAGDFTSATIPYFDTFKASSGTPDIHTYDSNWIDNSGTFSVSTSAIVQGATYSGSNALANWQGVAFNNDQWAQITAQNANSVGVSVRAAASANTAYFYRPNTSNTRVLYKVVAGTFTLLGTSNTAHTNIIGDTYRLVVIGTTIYAYLNGVLESFGSKTDSAISSGSAGLQAAQTNAAAPASCWNGGNVGLSGNSGIASASMALTGAASASTTADGSGNYSFSSLANGTYNVTPSLSGYIFSPSFIQWVLVGGVIYPTGLNFTATSAVASISGSVGIGGVTVAYTGTASGSVVSDSDGNYFIGSLADGPYTITPSLPNYAFTPSSASETMSGGVGITGVNFSVLNTPGPVIVL